MEIKSLGKTEISSLRDKIQSNLDSLGKIYGISFKLGTIRYDSNTFGVKVSGALVKPGESIDSVTFVSKCRKYGLKPTDLGREFFSNGERYNITGIKTANRKYPILGKRVSDGKKFKFSSVTVTMGLDNK